MTAHLSPPETDAPTDTRHEQSADRRPAAGRSETDAESTSVETDALLELLGDEYACDIIRALGSGPMPAKDLIEQHGMSRPTVYRRLDRLTEAGLVSARLSPARDGHHRQEFHLVVDEIELTVGEDGIHGRARADDMASD